MGRPHPPTVGRSAPIKKKQGDPELLRPQAPVKRGMLITDSLAQLQNLIKRQPDAYAEEFGAQWSRFKAMASIAQDGLLASSTQARNKDEDKLKEVTTFVCQVAHLYPKVTLPFLPRTIENLLLSSSSGSNGTSGGAAAVQLGPEVRKTFIQGLVLLRRRNVLTAVELLKTLFPLLSTTSSPNLRTMIIKTILSDIRTANLKTTNHQLNRTVQSLLSSMLVRSSSLDLTGTGVKGQQLQGKAGMKKGAIQTQRSREALYAVQIASILWKKHVWRDSRTVEIVASACFHSDTKVQSAAMHFFLALPGDEETGQEVFSDEEGEERAPDIKAVKHRQEINKKRRSTERKAQREIRSANQHWKQKRADKADGGTKHAAPALEMLQDPQTFVEKLYQRLAAYDRQYVLEHKILMMTLLARVGSHHRVTELSFFSYVLKYLAPSQLLITQILVAVAQAVHSHVPPEELLPLVRKIAHEFVHPGVSAQVVAAGLNAITQVCTRQPGAMDPTLLEDLIEYRESKDKGVSAGARALVAVFRDKNPAMLKKKERGKVVNSDKALRASSAKEAAFGDDEGTTHGFQGLDLLEKYYEERKAEGEEGDEDEEQGWDDWEIESSPGSESDESENGWIDVPSSGDERDVKVKFSDESSSSSSESEEDSDSESEDDDEAETAGKKGKPSKRSMKRLRREREEQRRERKRIKMAGGEAATPVVAAVAEEQEDDDDANESEESGSEGDDESDAASDSAPAAEEENMYKLAQTRFLTPADHAKIAELALAKAQEDAKGGGSAGRRKVAELKSATAYLTESEILSAAPRKKDTYEERLAKIAEGREGRDKYSSSRGKRLKEKEHSTTNEQKRRTKAFAMVANSGNVRRKKNAGLRDKRNRLRNHVVRQKKGGRRGNAG